MNKHYMIKITGHEENFEYHLEGKDFEDSVRRSLKVGGVLETFLSESKMTVLDFLYWIHLKKGGEFVDVYKSDSSIHLIKI